MKKEKYEKSNNGKGIGRCNKKQYITAAIIILTALTGIVGIASAADWHVYPGDPYPPIQNAINSAYAGDNIYVHTGTYKENVVVDKRLKLYGIGEPVVDANGSGIAITITAPADGSRIESFFVTGSGLTWDDAGIKIMSNDNIIINNLVINNTIGIWLHGSEFYKITNNIIRDNIARNNKKGIYVQFSSDNTIESNTAESSDEDGIMLYYSNDNTLIDNIADSNGGGIAACHSEGNEVKDCAITNSVWCDFYLGEAADLVSINTTFNGAMVDCDGSSKLTVRNYLHLQTVNEPSDPIQGADVQVKDNDEVIYASLGFGGSDPQTGADGYVRDILVTDRIYLGSSTATENTTAAEVKYGSFTFIDNPRDVDMSVSHTEIFISPKPDLVITEKWVCWPDNCTICYNVTNIGNGTAQACHNTTLYVNGVAVAQDHVPVDLAPGESYIGCFGGYAWTYTPPSDNITVCADNNKTVDEVNETNNCLTNIWRCGDVNCDGKVTMSDVRKVFNRYLDPNYPLDLPWAADVNCDGKVSMSDVRKVFNRYLDPSYALNCCCEGIR